MSEQKPEKPTKAPPWWVPILVAALAGWLLNNAITIFTFIATGVVNLSHIGIGPFLLTLGLSVVVGMIGVIIGIRLCLAAIFSLINAIFHRDSAPARTPTKWTEYQQQALDAIAFGKPVPQPPTRWIGIRYQAGEIAGAVFAWLIIPKWPSRPR